MQKGRFKQCQARRGTNARCDPLEDPEDTRVGHYCYRHLVGPNARKVFLNEDGSWRQVVEGREDSDDSDDDLA